jgi:hypothetical protein
VLNSDCLGLSCGVNAKQKTQRRIGVARILAGW